jgi:hypothetical protein
MVVGCHQHVAWLDVEMRDAGVVHGADGGDELGGEGLGGGGWHEGGRRLYWRRLLVGGLEERA